MQPTHFLYLAIPPRPDFIVQRTADEKAIMERHFAWIGALQERGLVAMTGISLDGAFGVALFAVTSQAEAEALVATDPAVVAGLFKSTRLHPLMVGYLRGPNG